MNKQSVIFWMSYCAWSLPAVTLGFTTSAVTQQQRSWSASSASRSSRMMQSNYNDLAAEWAKRNRDGASGSNGASSSSNGYQFQPAAPPKPAAMSMDELARQWAARNHDVEERPATPPTMTVPPRNGNSMAPSDSKGPAPVAEPDPWAAYMTVSEAVEVEDPSHLQAVLDETAPIQPPTPSMEELAQAWSGMTREDHSRPEAGPGPNPFAQYMTVSDDAPAPAEFMDAVLVDDDDEENQDDDGSNDQNQGYTRPEIADAVLEEDEPESLNQPPAPASGPSMEDLAKAWASMTREQPASSSSSVNFSSFATPKQSTPSPAPVAVTPSPASSASPSMDDLAKAWASMSREQEDPNSRATPAWSPRTPVAISTPAPAPAPAPRGPSMDDLAKAWASMSREQADPNSQPRVPAFVAPAPTPAPQSVFQTPKVPSFGMDQLAQEWAMRNKDVSTPPATPPPAPPAPVYSAESPAFFMEPMPVPEKLSEDKKEDVPAVEEVAPVESVENLAEPEATEEPVAEPQVALEAQEEPAPEPADVEVDRKKGTLIEKQTRIASRKSPLAESLEVLAAKWSARNEDKEDAKLASFYKPRANGSAKKAQEEKKERVRPAFLDNLGRILSPDPTL